MRVDIKLRVGKQNYDAGIRSTENNKYIWICPDLSNEQRQEVKLVEVLKDKGFVKNQKVDLKVSGKEIQLVLPSNPVQEIEEYKPSYDDLPDTEREAIIQSRIGQGKFRFTLIEYWNGCAVTGCKMIEVLKASHIKPWRESDNLERLDVQNGFLLTPNLDSAFDNGLISFGNDGNIIVSNLLDSEDMAILGIHLEMRIRKLEVRHMKYLEYHRENVFKHS